MSRKSGSSKRWLSEHERDSYVKAARRRGLRSRASYKLLQIQEKYGLMELGQFVVDLGASPGGFSQIARKQVGTEGHVIAVDLLEMAPLEGVDFIKGNFCEDSTEEKLLNLINGHPVDLVISDMAPNFSGVKEIDQPNSIYLVEMALEFVAKILRPGGSLMVKCFEGSGTDDLRCAFRQNFKRLNSFKPNASSNRSREIYLIGRNFIG